MKLKCILSYLLFVLTVYSLSLRAHAMAVKLGSENSNYKLIDTDKDGVADIIDLDDDNDGILDIDECYGYNPTGDADADGVVNYQDVDFEILNAYKICKSLDVDNDGIPNHLDLDSDNDGIPDNIEAQSTKLYTKPSGKISTNGVDVAYLKGLTVEDTDFDTIPDFIDLDSDNDGVLDEVEIQHNISNLNNDFDGDGIVDYRDLFNINPPNKASMYFDGVDDYVEGPQLMSTFNQKNTHGITLMCWVKNDFNDNDTSTRFIFGEENALALKAVGSKLEFTGNFKTSVGGWHTSSFSKTNGLKKGIWRHVTITIDFVNNEAGIFLDGKWVASRNLGYPGNHDIIGFYSELTTQSEKFMLGAQKGDITNLYNGAIDEVRVFNKVLQETDIQSIVFQEIKNNSGMLVGSVIPKQVGTNTWDDLVLYYSMNAITCAKIDDKSGQGNYAVSYNITALKPQTAPMPFVTARDGNWNKKSTWLYGNLWALPGDGISQNMSYSDENYTWGIYHIKHKVNLSARLRDVNTSSSLPKITALAILVGDTNDFNISNSVLTIGNLKQALGVKVSDYLHINGEIKLYKSSCLLYTEADTSSIISNYNDSNGTTIISSLVKGDLRHYAHNDLSEE